MKKQSICVTYTSSCHSPALLQISKFYSEVWNNNNSFYEQQIETMYYMHYFIPYRRAALVTLANTYLFNDYFIVNPGWLAKLSSCDDIWYLTFLYLRSQHIYPFFIFLYYDISHPHRINPMHLSLTLPLCFGKKLFSRRKHVCSRT